MGLDHPAGTTQRGDFGPLDIHFHERSLGKPGNGHQSGTTVDDDIA